jgi:ribosomal protein S18 acetylase RimI-like enzyme
MTEPDAPLVVRTAVVADAPSIAAIGRVAFPAVHNDVVGPEFAAVVVEQTYSIEALTECITRCTSAIDAEFLVAEQDDDVIGYLHYDSEGPEPELHRIYVDPGRKRGGVGSALMRELHARLPPDREYVLLVAEANTDAQAFYQRRGLVVERKVEGTSHHMNAIGIKVDVPPPPAPAFLMRYPANTS